ncbi:MAG: AAA family ATPase [Spirochaetales bacterium]|nr:MAG: AAA family ATPase [Spirochaetales bacterium]
MSDDLFTAAPPGGGSVSGASGAPLADRMRPRTLDEFIGQEHIVGPGRLLRRAIQRDRLSSIILSGPPGTGKTTLARIVANTTSSRFLSINAVLSGVQAIRDSIESARRERDLYDRRTILFVDEVHRWNKAQQDALLPWVENGTIILVGATTENPFFEVNKALVSRSRVFQLQSLGEDDLLKAARAALGDNERGYGRWIVNFEDGALEHLVAVADGDARSLLNALELAVETSVEPWPPTDGCEVRVTMQAAEESIQKRAVLYDRDGDYHYDASSALIKSLRGSDPDAALYWVARMVYAGEDPRFIFRRLLISAAEDVGLADPQALRTVEACTAAFERIGMPEGQFFLAQAALYLATAPKSNSTMAYYDALAAVEKEKAEVPDHLKDASRDADGFGHGAGYLYPHAYKGHWAAQQYLPDSLRGAVFYRPGAIGHEATLRDEVLRRRDTQLAAWLAGDESPGGAAVARRVEEAWSARTGTAALLSDLRNAVMAALNPQRHENILVLNADDGLLAREASRRCTDGSVCAMVRDAAAIERLAYAYSDVEELLRPAIVACPDPASVAQKAIGAVGHEAFDSVIAIGFLSANTEEALSGLRACSEAFLSARFVLAERRPAAKGFLPGLVADRLAPEQARAFGSADAAFYDEGLAGGHSEDSLVSALSGIGLSVASTVRLDGQSERRLGDREAEAWMADSSAYGAFVRVHMGEEMAVRILEALKAAFASGAVAWPASWLVAVAARAQAL